MTRFAVSNTDSAVLLYMDKETREKLTGHISVRIEGSIMYVMQGGGINVNEGKHNKTEINCQAQVQIGAITKVRKFGKTEFNFAQEPDGSYEIYLSSPVMDYKPQKVYKNTQPDKVLEAPADDAIRAAVQLINKLDRDKYKLFLNTTDGSLSIRQETVFS